MTEEYLVEMGVEKEIMGKVEEIECKLQVKVK